MAYDAERYKNDPEYREYRKNMTRQYYAKVKDTPEFKAKNIERVSKWRKENPDKVRALARTEKQQEYRRNYRRQHPPVVTPEMLERRRNKARENYKFSRRVLTDPEFAKTVSPEIREKVFSNYEKSRAYAKRYYDSNREQILARNRERRDANLEHYRKLGRDSYHRRAKAKAIEVNKQIKEVADEL